MSDQVSHELVNDCPRVDFGEMALYAVIFGPVEENCGWGRGFYECKIEPDPNRIFTTASLNGYICRYHLNYDGKLILASYVYPFSEIKATLVNETLKGDFYMVMKQDFSSPRLYVPFADGKIVEEKSKWLDEETLQIDNSDSIQKSESFSLDQITMNFKKAEQVLELSHFIHNCKTFFLAERALGRIKDLIDGGYISWVKADSIAIAIQNWPDRYQKKGKILLNAAAMQLLSQAMNPQYRYTKPKILKTIIDYFHDTKATVKAKVLLENREK